MKLNRTIAPEFYPIRGFRLIAPEEKIYGNGLKSFIFQGGDQDLVRIEWIFNNRITDQEDTLLHSCLPAMMLEGTDELSNAEIADFVDFHGAFLVPEFHSDHCSLTLFSLTRHLPGLLPLIRQLLTAATFPEKEWKTHLRNRKQRLEIALRKNDVLARREFNKQLFGQTRYGISPDPDSFGQISREDLVSLYQRQIQPANCTLFVAGKIDKETASLIDTIFGDQWENHTTVAENSIPVFPDTPGKTMVTTIPEALQSAIRIGYRSILRSDPDFPGLQFVNTLLGGYFGSRLMMNIREDKGYTYGIGSGLAVMEHASYYTIATEVGVEFTDATLTEIEKEIARLKEEPVPAEEMDLVRNYLMGSLLGSLENIFSHADKFKQTYFSGMDPDYYNYYQDEILRMDARKVQQLAETYLDFDRMEKIIVGNLIR